MSTVELGSSGFAMEIPDAWYGIDIHAGTVEGDITDALDDGYFRYHNEVPRFGSEPEVDPLEHTAHQVEAIRQAASMLRSSAESSPQESLRCLVVDVVHPAAPPTVAVVTCWLLAGTPEELTTARLVSELVDGLEADVRKGLQAEELITGEVSVTLVSGRPYEEMTEQFAIGIARPNPTEAVVIDGRSAGLVPQVIVEIVESFALSVRSHPSQPEEAAATEVEPLPPTTGEPEH